MDSPPTRRPTLSQVLLGLFIVWQLIFLVAANLIEFFPHRPPEREELTDLKEVADPDQVPRPLAFMGKVCDRYAEATGQYQVWWLFAPSFPRQATFPAVELRWDDGPPLAPPGVASLSPHSAGASAAHPPVRLHSYFEPDDPRAYFHGPGSRDRHFHYEVRLGLVLVNWDDQVSATQADEWREFLTARVRRQWRSIRAYLRWRLDEFQREHPEVPAPRQVILALRLYRSPAPGQPADHWGGPYDRPLARWCPAEDGPADCLPVEVYDPFTRCFERLPRTE